MHNAEIASHELSYDNLGHKNLKPYIRLKSVDLNNVKQPLHIHKKV